jgi:hydroxymethylpyrimidine/phosphomethylpyrimidine kinase
LKVTEKSSFLVFDPLMKCVLTIAGYDPSSGAGATADLMVFAAHDLFGTSCITGLTVQSTVGVLASHPIDARIVRETLNCLHADLPAAGIKIGMLGTAAVVATVAEFLARLRAQGSRVPVVLDPVLRSSSGRELLDDEGMVLLRERLLPLVDWVTPNLYELGRLCGRPVSRRDKVPGAARALQHGITGLNVLATGGDLDKPDDCVVTAAGEMRWLEGEKIESRSTHGTGCALSSALLSRLVLGDRDFEAVLGAKEYVAEAIRRADPMGLGKGPVAHLWPLRRSKSSS